MKNNNVSQGLQDSIDELWKQIKRWEKIATSYEQGCQDGYEQISKLREEVKTLENQCLRWQHIAHMFYTNRYTHDAELNRYATDAYEQEILNLREIGK